MPTEVLKPTTPISNGKILEYKALIAAELSNKLTSDQMKLALNEYAIMMMEYSSPLGTNKNPAATVAVNTDYDSKQGQTSTVLRSQFLPWITKYPLAMKFLTTASASYNPKDFMTVIKAGDYSDNTVRTVTPQIFGTTTSGIGNTGYGIVNGFESDGTTAYTWSDVEATLAPTNAQAPSVVPNTYVLLHNNLVSNEAGLAGLIALRSLNVPATNYSNGVQLAVGTNAASFQLSDVNMLPIQSGSSTATLYSTWGADKFKAIMNKGVLEAIRVDTLTDGYDTIDEVAAIYTAWTSTTVTAKSFFASLAKMNASVEATILNAKTVYKGAAATADADQRQFDSTAMGQFVKVADLYQHIANATRYKAVTSDAFTALLGTQGATPVTFSTLNALAISTTTANIAKYAALTSANVISLVKNAGATYYDLEAVYTADPDFKFKTLTSDNAVKLALKGYTTSSAATAYAWDFPTMNTNYGTTYNAVKDQQFADIIAPANWPYMEQYVTYANLANAQARGLMKCMNSPEIQDNLLSTQTMGSVVGGTASVNTMYGNLIGMGSASYYSGLEDITANTYSLICY